MRLRNIIILLFIGFFSASQAQEQLVGLQMDASLNNYYRTHQLLWKSQEQNEPMFLPFFDNFNQADYRPNPNLWMGDNVFVNKRFQLFPPDLGVVTFDAMDGSGHIHENANQFPFPADTLTSQPIRLDSIMDPTLRPLLVKDSIYFSFYYQPQGRGNAPEEEDRLYLEFYSPSLDHWFQMWDSQGMPLDTFYKYHGTYSQQVFIPLLDSAKFFHAGFQFRFHNYASLSGNNQPDWQANADHWNVDMVWLDRNRTITDSSFRKIAFVNKPPSMIKRYQSMPYRQYKNDPTNSMKDTIKSILISNLDDIDYAASYSYSISNQSTQESEYDGGSAAVFPFSENGYVQLNKFRNPPVVSFFSIYNEPEKSYTITHIINDIGLTGVGDTAIRVQNFSNYYAYDDGTAEAGYGMSVKNAKAAMKFKLNTKDTLRRVQFYFNPTLNMANDQYFNIVVWKSIDPEEIIYKKRVKAQFTDGLYQFYTYDLDTAIVVANEFYIGFQQLTAENLNIGFDYAIDSKEYLFYSINNGGWSPSIYSGSLMIRPLFGEHIPMAVNDLEKNNQSFKIFPNPLTGSYLHIDINQEDIPDQEISIFSLTGQEVIRQAYDSSIDVSSLKNGIYLIRLHNSRSGISKTQKLLIRR